MTRPSRWPTALALLAMGVVAWFLISNFSSADDLVFDADSGGLRQLGVAQTAPVTGSAEPATASAATPAQSEPDNTAPAPTPIPLAPEPANDTTALDWVLDETAKRTGISPLRSPALDCVSVDPAAVVLQVAGSPSRYRCPAGGVSAVADGRILMVGGNQPVVPVATPTPGQTNWDWQRGLSLGRFVVVDHGAMDGAGSVVTIYSRLGTVDPRLRIGAEILAGEVIGTLNATEAAAASLDSTSAATGAEALRELRRGEFMFEIWVDDEFAPAEFQVDTSKALDWASTLGQIGSAPVDLVCGFPAGISSLLPNAPREYRTGVHRGVDFNCGRGNNAYSYADGTVVLVIDDFVDPTVAARQAVLANAAAAGSTPHWILMMLYGKVVVIDHGDIPGVGRVTTISAHLDSIDPAITSGSRVSAGQRLGEIGNAGTNAGAAGSNATIHLHWELFVDGTHLAKGLSAGDTSAIYQAALCRIPESLNGC